MRNYFKLQKDEVKSSVSEVPGGCLRCLGRSLLPCFVGTPRTPALQTACHSVLISVRSKLFSAVCEHMILSFFFKLTFNRFDSLDYNLHSFVCLLLMLSAQALKSAMGKKTGLRKLNNNLLKK